MSAGSTKRYRVSTSLVEIYEVVESAVGKDGHFLWHIVDDKRITYPIQLNHLETENNQVMISVENKSEAFRDDETIYIHLSTRDATFKSQILKMSKTEIHLSFPKELLMTEMRASKRYQFHLNDEKNIQMRRVVPADAFHEKSHLIQVFDVSSGGFGIFIPQDLLALFSTDVPVSVEFIGDQKLSAPIIGKIVPALGFEVKNKNSEEKGTRYGIKLETPIPDSILEKFIVRPKIFEIAEERLIVDMAHRKRIHDSMNETLKKVSKSRSFKEQFKSFVVNREDTDYIKIHTNLLIEVLCSVGLKLGWVTDKTLDKLVYVAFLHDIYLFNHPHLAKIKNRHELERNKELSDAERKMYLDAPLYAAELARRDPDAYPDSVKILIQQRELPDGSGFPYAITGAGLTPLSSLFIFCHYLVDYMIEDSNWNLDAFLKAHQRVLKGGYFSKIFMILQS